MLLCLAFGLLNCRGEAHLVRRTLPRELTRLTFEFVSLTDMYLLNHTCRFFAGVLQYYHMIGLREVGSKSSMLCSNLCSCRAFTDGSTFKTLRTPMWCWVLGLLLSFSLNATPEIPKGLVPSSRQGLTKKVEGT